MLTMQGIALPPARPTVCRLSEPHPLAAQQREAHAEVRSDPAAHTIDCSSVEGERLLAAHEILAVFSSENYSTVITERQRWLVRRSMSEWETMLPAGTFIRVHRTAIVNLTAVESLERRTGETTLARLRGFPQPVRVSRSRQLALRVALAERR